MRKITICVVVLCFSNFLMAQSEDTIIKAVDVITASDTILVPFDTVEKEEKPVVLHETGVVVDFAPEYDDSTIEARIKATFSDVQGNLAIYRFEHPRPLLSCENKRHW